MKEIPKTLIINNIIDRSPIKDRKFTNLLHLVILHNKAIEQTPLSLKTSCPNLSRWT